MFIVGIDPGVTGCVSVINKDGELVRHFMLPFRAEGDKRPVVDVCEIVNEIGRLTGDITIYVEQVGFMGLGAETSAFTSSILSAIYNRIIGAIEVKGYKYKTVTPRKWQNVIIEKKEESEEEKTLKLDTTKKGKRKLKAFRRKNIKNAVKQFCLDNYPDYCKNEIKETTSIKREGVYDSIAIATYGYKDYHEDDV